MEFVPLSKKTQVPIYFYRESLTWSNFTWSKLSFFSWSKVSFSVDQIFWDFSVDRKIWSSAKKEPTDFGSWLKVLIMVFWHLKSFDQVPKFASYFLAVDQKFLN